jgi:hypothetical protein
MGNCLFVVECAVAYLMVMHNSLGMAPFNAWQPAAPPYFPHTSVWKSVGALLTVKACAPS